MADKHCSNCGTSDSQKWIKKGKEIFCSKTCQDAFDKKGGPSGTCEFC